jgi:hypothetical protein
LTTSPRNRKQLLWRHSGTCDKTDEFSHACTCPKWLRWSQGGERVRIASGTATYSIAEAKAYEIQRNLDLGLPVQPAASGGAVSGVGSPVGSIEGAIEDFFKRKRREKKDITDKTLAKVRTQLARFAKFLAARAKFSPLEITAKDIDDYDQSMTEWAKSGLTHQKAQDHIRGFVKFICPNAAALLKDLPRVELTREDLRRIKPKPFTEDEINRILKQVPVTFVDKTKAMRVTTRGSPIFTETSCNGSHSSPSSF